MKKWLLILALIGSAHISPALSKVSKQLSQPGNNCVSIDVTDQSTVSITTAGPYVTALQVFLQINMINPQTGSSASTQQIAVWNPLTSAFVSSLATGGFFQASVAGGNSLSVCTNGVGSNGAIVFLGATTAVASHVGSGSGGGGAVWGAITGTLSNQTDLQTALDAAKAWSATTFPSAGEIATFGAGKAVEITNTAGTVAEGWFDRASPGFSGVGWITQVFDNTFTKGVTLAAYEDSAPCNGITFDGGVFAVSGPLGGNPIFCAGIAGGRKAVTFADGTEWTDTFTLFGTNYGAAYQNSYTLSDSNGKGGFSIYGPSPNGFLNIGTEDATITKGGQAYFLEASTVKFSHTFANGLASLCDILACIHGVWVDGTTGATYNDVTPAVDDSSKLTANTAYVTGQAGAANPIINGTAAPGTSLRYSRQDHVHPTDTTRAPTASPTFTGSITAPLFNSTTNCASSASPAVCAAAPAGRFVVAAGSTTIVVNTTAVTANSEININNDSSLGTALSVTCNTTLLSAPWQVTARTAGTSFTLTIAVAPVTNPECFSYSIVN